MSGDRHPPNPGACISALWRVKSALSASSINSWAVGCRISSSQLGARLCAWCRLFLGSGFQEHRLALTLLSDLYCAASLFLNNSANDMIRATNQKQKNMAHTVTDPRQCQWHKILRIVAASTAGSSPVLQSMARPRIRQRPEVEDVRIAVHLWSLPTRLHTRDCQRVRGLFVKNEPNYSLGL